MKNLITRVSIKDFAIIENIDISLYPGLNIFTGETGSGKSIIIEAISVALGARADNTLIRTGRDKSIIQIVIDNKGDEFIITREIYTTGKSSCKINDELVTLSHLNQFCKRFADIHGQYDHQSLLNPESHINLVDSYSKDIIQPLKNIVKENFEKYTESKSKLNKLLANLSSNERRRDFMRFEYNELVSSKLKLDEDILLNQELTISQNSEKIYQNLSGIYDSLYSSTDSCFSELGRSMHQINEISTFDLVFPEFENVISDSYYKIEDLCFSIRKYIDKIDFSQNTLDEIIERLEIINTLKKKYKKDIPALLSYIDELESELALLENYGDAVSDLENEVEIKRGELLNASIVLTENRRNISLIIQGKINVELKELNFNNADLEVKITQRIDDKGNIAFSENGIDRVEFMISTNLGEPKKPLSKIASGGEISRIMLAFKRIIGAYDEIPTMIFDEIDIGISGATASIVGSKLRDISRNHQVVCITHLPQIASLGDYNFKITKNSDANHTFTDLILLDEKNKVNEIARLLGGLSITESTIRNAEELISQGFSGK
ncbi:MAG: DNA repair protein RecN [Eubacteriales bacterium]